MIRFNRYALLCLSRLLLGMMLFTQLAQAAQACVMVDLKPGTVFATEMMPEDCDLYLSKNNCLMEYVRGDQVVDSFHAWGFYAQNITTPIVTPIKLSLPPAGHFVLASTPLRFNLPVYLQFLRLLI